MSLATVDSGLNLEGNRDAQSAHQSCSFLTWNMSPHAKVKTPALVNKALASELFFWH